MPIFAVRSDKVHQRYDTTQAVADRRDLAEKVGKLEEEFKEEKRAYVDITQVDSACLIPCVKVFFLKAFQLPQSSLGHDATVQRHAGRIAQSC